MDERTGDLINIKGKEVLIVTFQTKGEEDLGPINVYLDKNSDKVLGVV
ncbi:hypothetical protein [Bacillus sp. FJAT-27445]|nr:hypothetical protein [Bacillus sp. FJAT-27445]